LSKLLIETTTKIKIYWLRCQNFEKNEMAITKSFEILNKAQAKWLSWHTVVSFGQEQVQRE
jgi:hypothetical protein